MVHAESPRERAIDMRSNGPRCRWQLLDGTNPTGFNAGACYSNTIPSKAELAEQRDAADERRRRLRPGPGRRTAQERAAGGGLVFDTDGCLSPGPAKHPIVGDLGALASAQFAFAGLDEAGFSLSRRDTTSSGFLRAGSRASKRSLPSAGPPAASGSAHGHALASPHRARDITFAGQHDARAVSDSHNRKAFRHAGTRRRETRKKKQKDQPPAAPEQRSRRTTLPAVGPAAPEQLQPESPRSRDRWDVSVSVGVSMPQAAAAVARAAQAAGSGQGVQQGRGRRVLLSSRADSFPWALALCSGLGLGG
jgi:hypothetical protein